MKAPFYCSHKGNVALNSRPDLEEKGRLPTFHARLSKLHHIFNADFDLPPPTQKRISMLVIKDETKV